jgi:hypothetical protein
MEAGTDALRNERTNSHACCYRRTDALFALADALSLLRARRTASDRNSGR